MALSANTVWEIHSGGSDTNGGGFVTGATGTDYSQQDAAQWALTGVTSSGSGNVVLSASAASTMVGNIAYVVSGTNFTVGEFQITSVSAGVSITFSTNSAGASICTGVGSSGVINIGGAKGTPGYVSKYCTVVAGMIAHQKGDGTYTITTSTLGAGGPVKLATNIGIRWYGYTTTRGDGGVATISAGSVGSITMFKHDENYPTGQNQLVRNIKCDGNSQSSVIGFDSSQTSYRFVGHLENCEAVNCTTGFAGVVLTYFRCKATACTTGFQNGNCIKCRAKGCVTGFLADTVSRGTWIMCLAFDGTIGFDTNTYTTTCLLNIAVDNSSHGFRSSSYNMMWTSGNLAAFNGGYGFSLPAADYPLFQNATYSNTSGATNQTLTFAFGHVTLSGDPFNNRASDDYSFNSTTGAGASLRAAFFGLPGQTDNTDIGGLQHQDPAGGGGSSGSRLVGPSSLITPGVCL